ncbi:MAG: hypothetical protein VXY89_11020, partial [SAR324 cluster bacterium]|nr:hypothetical protein [SAR324 cluster bacterium]
EYEPEIAHSLLGAGSRLQWWYSLSPELDTVSALGTPTVSGNQGTIPYFVAECQDLGNTRCE